MEDGCFIRGVSVRLRTSNRFRTKQVDGRTNRQPGERSNGRHEDPLRPSLDTLKDIYFAEKQIPKTLPKLPRTAQSEVAKAGFLQHRDETQSQIERLEQVLELLGKEARGKTCESIQGIIAEGEEIIEEFKDSPALEAGLTSTAQVVEHTEIARYRTLIEWANQLGLTEAVPLLRANLDEQEATVPKFTRLAKASANAKEKEAS